MLAPTALLEGRQARVRDALAQGGLDALVVTRLPNVFYLTNLSASAAVVIVTPSQLYLVTDFRYSAAVHRLLSSAAAPPATIQHPVESSYDEAVVDVLTRIGAARVGFEAAHATVKQQASWAARFVGGARPAEWVATDGLVEHLRTVKDVFERDLLSEAARRLSEVARGVLADLTGPGRTELEVAADIDYRVKRAGFEKTAFDTIVASGPNSALPHARPGTRTVTPGDLLLLDFGGVFHGYCVDLTRTVAVGPATSEQRRLYRAVHEAQRQAIAAVRAGTTGDAVDHAARGFLASQGLADAFGHSTGHGLGLDVHEEPRIARARDGGPPAVTLQRGMVCTIEPGVYLPDFGGVRLEDDVWVGDDAGEVLTDVPFDDRLM